MKSNKLKLFSVFALILTGLIAVSGIANAASVPVTIESVKIDGETLGANETLGGIVRGETIDIKVKIPLEDCSYSP